MPGRPSSTPGFVRSAHLTAPSHGCEDDECVQLAGRLAVWHATKSAEAEAVRTCFRIVPPPREGEEGVDPADVPARPRRREGHLGRFGARLAHRFRPPGGRRPEPGGLRRGRLVRRARTDRHRAPRRAPRRAPSARPRSGGPSRPCAGKDAVLGDPLRLHHGRCGHLDLPSRRAPLCWKRPDSACSRPRGGARRGPGSECGSRRGPASKGGTSTGTIGLDGLCDIRWEAVLGDDTLEPDRAPPAGSAEAAAGACARPMGGAAPRGALGRHHRGRQARRRG